MNDENTLEIIEQARRKMHETVDRRFDDLIALVQGGEIETESDFELSLCDRPTYFKGKKPVSVIYPDNTEFETSTWKKVAKQLLNECAGDAVMYDRLHRLCDNVSGRDRVLLSESPDGMNSPICFADGMYLESNDVFRLPFKTLADRSHHPIFCPARKELRQGRCGNHRGQYAGYYLWRLCSQQQLGRNAL